MNSTLWVLEPALEQTLAWKNGAQREERLPWVCLAASGLHALHLFCRCSDETGEGVFIHAGQGALPGVGPRDYVQPVPGL